MSSGTLVPSHFALAVVWRVNPATGEVEFLVIDSVSTDSRSGKKTEKQVKFPGGMNRLPDEPVAVTVQRELMEETYLTVDFESTHQIWVKSIPEKAHTKYGFIANFSECRGGLRTEELHDAGDEMSPPYWAEYRMLALSLWRTHQDAYTEAVRALQNQRII